MTGKNTTSAPTRKRSRPTGYLGTLFGRDTSVSRRIGLLFKGAFVAGLITFIGIGVYAIILIPLTPTKAQLEAAKIERPSTVLSGDGREIAQYQRLPRTWIPLSRVAQPTIDALISAEDHRFYQHQGIDYRRLFSSGILTLAGRAQGGSTITMQLARNLYPEEIGKAPALTRKLKELITAVKIESVYTKEEILEAYLNSVPFLYNAFGIERGARTYFSKSASDLNVRESCTLIGMLKGTSYYNPVLHPERALRRRNVVMSQMVKRGKLKQETYDWASKTPIVLMFKVQPIRTSLAPHFTEYVRKQVKLWADENGYDVYSDGLVVHTTLDVDLQQSSQRAVERQLDALQAVVDVEWSKPSVRLISTQAGDYKTERRRVKPFRHFWSSNKDLAEEYIRSTRRYRQAVAGGASEEEALRSLQSDDTFVDSLRSVKTRLESGFVAIDPHTGFVKAWVGSRNYYRDQYDHVAYAKRQPGSTFKPFVYAAALEHGYNPDDTFLDEEMEFSAGGNQTWKPRNVEGSTGQEITLRDALTYSKNTVTAQLVETLGPDRVADYARRLGVNRSELDEVPSIGLGTSAVTLLEMVSAYATIAAGGVYHEPTLMTRIEDQQGNVLVSFNPSEYQAVPAETALTLLDMMRGVVDEGTGQRIRSIFSIEADVAGKTGTTQDNADGWFILMHPDLVGGSWVGFNDQRITFRSDYWGQGAHNALYVVGDTYRKALEAGELSPYAEFPDPPSEFDLYDEDPDSYGDQFDSWVDRTWEHIGNIFSDDEEEKPASRKNRRTQEEPDMQPPDIPEYPEENQDDPSLDEQQIRKKRIEALERTIREVKRARKDIERQIESVIPQPPDSPAKERNKTVEKVAGNVLKELQKSLEEIDRQEQQTRDNLDTERKAAARDRDAVRSQQPEKWSKEEQSGDKAANDPDRVGW